MKRTVEVCVFAEDGAAGDVAGGWKPHCRKWMSAAGCCCCCCSASVFSGLGWAADWGRGRMNCGWDFADDAIRL